VRVSDLATAPRPFTVLLVCTGNICRSALGERLGRAYLTELLGDRASAILLRSGGTRAVIGSGMHPETELVLAGFGGVPGDFRAKQLHTDLAVDADLTLTMTRAHRRAVLEVAPRALARTFTLREAADLLRSLDDPGPAGSDFPECARALVQAMGAARSRRESWAEDDIRDPIGQPLEVHQEVGQAIADALLPVLGRFAALVPERPAGNPGQWGFADRRPPGPAGASTG
jgi:protein-tyrosine-phosphatase